MPAMDPYLVRVTPQVYAYVQPDGGWCLNNAGVVSDGGTTLLVDTAATERRARLLRDAVVGQGLPLPRTLVNTHHHGDHTYGNGVFAQEATIVAHETCRSQQIAVGQQLHAIWPETEFGEVPVVAPSVTYRDSMTLYVGQTEARVLHPGVSHTTGDSVVHLPGQGVVFTGDLVFSGGTPFLFNGSLAGSLRALGILRSLDAEVVVPGHGPVTDPSAYDVTERYLRFVEDVAREGHAKGLSPLETANATDLGEFAVLRESERLVANLHRAYAELDGLPEGAELDPLLVFGDMSTVNGGRPVACHA